MTAREGLSLIYYLIAATAFVLAFIRVIYGWFRDFDNANRFTQDMATVHLPYIHEALFKIVKKLDLEFDSPPPINFISDEPKKH